MSGEQNHTIVEPRSPPLLTKKQFEYRDILKFADTGIYSSLGSPIDSKKSRAPQYSFGTSTRDAYLKRFGNKYMPIDDTLGRNSPSPEKGQKFIYRKAPSYKIGTGLKNSLDKIHKYDHYSRKDIDMDINQADKARRRSLVNVKVSDQRRFPPSKTHLSPGPQDYSTLPNPERPSPPKYTMSPRRLLKAEDPFINISATSQILGPGSYLPEQSYQMSQELITPKYSVPKALRKSFVDKNTIDSNQTYDLSQSMGEQLLAKRRTSPAYKIGKEKLDGRKSSIFSAHMENKPASVRISLPKI